MIGEVEKTRTSPTEDGFDTLAGQARAAATKTPEDGTGEGAPNYLMLLRDAEQRSNTYVTENLRAAWDASLRAFRNKHFAGSKYWHSDYRNRSKLFRSKTRSAVRKAGASAVSALFSTANAVKTTAGNESDPNQVANAALLQELFNYRTDRTSGQAAIPWFRICAGAHQDAMLQSACVSKQYWKLELRHVETQTDDETGDQTEIHEPFIDRPDCMLFPMENIGIDPAANWLNPIQSAAFFFARHPMSVDEVMQMQHHPLNPWKKVSQADLRAMATNSDTTAKSTRQQRDGATDRLDSRFSGTRSFEIVWVYEVFIRWHGRDMHFWSAGNKAYLTDPQPVEQVYPEQGGERPYTFGVINLESHRLFPMSPVESWQQQQIEINDFANLTLDTAKLSVSPVTKVVRGKNVDLAALTRRGPNAQILVEGPEDVSWDRPPSVDAAAFTIQNQLNVDFDDLAGQFNSGSVQTNRSLNETVGGLNLISGAANSIAEFDLRVWIETWAEPTIAQIMKLIQYYESDETILALCGQKAQLFEKFGISRIDDQLLQQQVKVRIDAGASNADPQQKMARLGGAINLVMPLFRDNPDVQSGAIKINAKAIADEAFAIAGYRDGSDRFIEVGQPNPPPPQAQLAIQKLQAEIAALQNKSKGALLAGLAAVAKVDLGDKQLEADTINAQLDQHLRATDLGHQHGHALATAQHQRSMDQAGVAAPMDDGGQGTQPEQPDQPQPDQGGGNVLSAILQLLQQPRARQFHFQRGADGRITGAIEVSGGAAGPPQAPQMPPPQQTPQRPPQGGLFV